MTRDVTAVCLAFVLFSSIADATEPLDPGIVGTWEGMREKNGKCEFLAWTSDFASDGRLVISFFSDKKRRKPLRTDRGYWNTNGTRIELKIDGVSTVETYRYTVIDDYTVKYVNTLKDSATDCPDNYEFIEYRAGTEFASKEYWYPQRAITADFGFSVEADSDYFERYAVQTIRIINRKTGVLLQEIRDIDGMGTWVQPSEIVRVVDANSDGYPDIEVPFADGGAGPNNTNYYYLFDPISGLFEFNQQLSDLSQPVVNLDGTVSSASRGSCCQHHSETYRFYQGQLLLIADWDEAYTADGKWIETTTRKLINGRWYTKFRRAPQRQ